MDWRRAKWVTLIIGGLALGLAALYGLMAICDALLPDPWENLAPTAALLTLLWLVMYWDPGGKR